MAVRNFWIEVDVDGYKTALEGGPRRKDGGMKITLYQRKEGDDIETAIEITCKPCADKLITTVDIDGKEVGKYETNR